jgi:hypothetical protein
MKDEHASCRPLLMLDVRFDGKLSGNPKWLLLDIALLLCIEGSSFTQNIWIVPLSLETASQ